MTEPEQEGTGYSFVLGGREYRGDDLTLNDVAEIEDEFGEGIDTLAESGRVRVMLYMAWCIRRHNEPELTMEDVGSTTLGELVKDQAAEAKDATSQARPTKAPAPPKKRASAGSRGTRASSASTPGTSDA